MFGLQSLNQRLSTCTRFHPFRITYVSLAVAKKSTAGRGKRTVFLYSSPCIVQTIEDLRSHLPLGSSKTQSSDVLREGVHVPRKLCRSPAAPSHVPIMDSFTYQYLTSNPPSNRDGQTRLGLIMYSQKRLHANSPRDPKCKRDNLAWEFPVRVHRVGLVQRHVSGVVGCVGRFRAFDHRASWGGNSSQLRKEKGWKKGKFIFRVTSLGAMFHALTLSYPIMGWHSLQNFLTSSSHQVPAGENNPS